MSRLTQPQRARVVRWLQELGQGGSLLACADGFQENGQPISDENVLNRLSAGQRGAAFEPVRANEDQPRGVDAGLRRFM